MWGEAVASNGSLGVQAKCDLEFSYWVRGSERIAPMGQWILLPFAPLFNYGTPLFIFFCFHICNS